MPCDGLPIWSRANGRHDTQECARDVHDSQPSLESLGMATSWRLVRSRNQIRESGIPVTEWPHLLSHGSLDDSLNVDRTDADEQ